ncbi:glycoside hydrolase family 18 protein [Dissoconium aciculare CBS 342.82]|uniref:chitinase n=1 Tax=Dissoconium aciculare CBS 342.82 TaxID=1314786 RepID=A0A6J3MLN5_9PEZI|nr:glycoside hydrolase family 18 protein [Dissoconium aciculare CBS 342.82]KAF1827902.1 glycoside hydrolase family 18 protein [Dissoconium aciculare CBS 342.82]
MALVAERAPAQQLSVGFFDAWGYSRPCGAMTAKQVDTTKYTHVLWSFLTIKDDLSLGLGDETQWKDFLAMPNVKKLASLGGDSVGHNLATALKKDMDGFVNKIADFLDKNKGLDGLDIDWEFPDANEANTIYLDFVRKLRSKLGPGKILSVDVRVDDSVLTWPLKEMAKEVDFFIVMSYGYYSYKWGATAKYDCPRGDCLRPHMDLRRVTETFGWVTKDVPASKFVMGIANYGNGVVLANAACVDPRDKACTYIMNQAPAESRCMKGSDARGTFILNEIRTIVAEKKPGTQTLYDKDSDSSILIYNNPNAIWIGYLDDNTIASRKQRYASWGAAGSAEWTLTMR